MKPILLITVAFVAQAAQAQKNGGCTNPAIQWIINPIYVDGATPNKIQGDGSPYIDGQSGVTTRINVCSGTFDATLLLGNRGRVLSYDFSGLLASNSYTPAWALSGSTVTGAGFLNVRNIWFVPSGSNRDEEYTFTTRLGSNPPVSSGSPDFPMANPSPDAPSSIPNVLALSNTPYPDSLVIVHHCPANTNTAACPNIVHETWFAYPDPNPTASGVSQTGRPITQVGNLLVTVRGSKVNAGEFSMPFSFTISLLQ